MTNPFQSPSFDDSPARQMPIGSKSSMLRITFFLVNFVVASGFMLMGLFLAYIGVSGGIVIAIVFGFYATVECMAVSTRPRHILHTAITSETILRAVAVMNLMAAAFFAISVTISFVRDVQTEGGEVLFICVVMLPIILYLVACGTLRFRWGMAGQKVAAKDE